MISIIIVHYHVKEALLACLQSITDSKTKIPYEIIVIDNDEEKTIEKDIKKKFPEVVYIKNNNKGFGEANNCGAEIAKGEYLFFLNPDTKVSLKAIDNLYSFISTKEKVGAVAPLLLGNDKKPYRQGERLLTPIRGAIALSFINKLFPNNPISRHYWDVDAVHSEVRQIDIVPGTAFMIKNSLFHKIGGFDEKFFLYFEEFDLCKRLTEKGYKNYSIPDAQVIHVGGLSTKQREDKVEIFSASRYYYFKKHFGVVNALFVQFIASVGKAEAIVGLFVLLGGYLLSFQLLERGSFIGDQGWFYLSARDMLLTGEIPLVGIPSSRPWLHQGALWTYLLGGALFIGKFHPLSGYILSILLGIVTPIALYILSKQLYGKKVGVVATALYTTSLSVVHLHQMPYHTTPIPLVTIGYLMTLYTIRKGKIYSIPIALVLLCLLYQLELFSVILAPLLVFSIWYSILKKNIIFSDLYNFRFLFITFASGILSFLPILLYDLKNGFPQTFGFVAWMGYSLLKAIGVVTAATESTPFLSVGKVLIEEIKMLIFYPSMSIALLVIIPTLFIFMKHLVKKRKYAFYLLGLSLLLPLFGILVTRTPSDAYLPILFPTVVLLVAYGIVTLFRNNIVFFLLTFAIVFSNVFSIIFLYPQKYPMEKFSIGRRIEVAQTIVNEASGRPFTIVGRGNGSQFASFTMNHEYLLWWLGGKVVSEPVDLQFIITETPEGIFITSPSQYARMLQ